MELKTQDEMLKLLRLDVDEADRRAQVMRFSRMWKSANRYIKTANSFRDEHCQLQPLRRLKSGRTFCYQQEDIVRFISLLQELQFEKESGTRRKRKYC